MDTKSEKLLEQALPDGQLVNRAWLLEHGYNRPRVDYFLRAGKLEAVNRGIYRRPGPPLKWEHVVYSLNEMGCEVHVGGRSAMELQGMAHYLSPGGVHRIDLYGVSRVPAWVSSYSAKYRFVIHKRLYFETLPKGAVKTKSFGSWDWPVPHAGPELALLELLTDVQQTADFSVVDKFFEAAANLRPELVQALLRTCKQIKAKRLFLWFSDRHQHDWHRLLETKGVDLGSGKRMIIKGGAYDDRYQITVPKEMTSGSEQPLF